MHAVWSIWPATWNQLVFKMESPNRQLPVVVPAVRNYMIVTAAYWGFTLTDGALRMLVLLHFYKLGYSPFMLSLLFLLYEAAGVLANLIGGWLATRFGIARMLTVGLMTQIVGFILLSQLDPSWTAAMSVAWVVIAQGICGVAKDLTKTASKSAIKITQAEAKTQSNGQLFKWVAWFTGSKNAMKGFGFFLGGVLLQAVGFQWSLTGHGRITGFDFDRRHQQFASHDRQEQSLQISQRIVFKKPRPQRTFCCSRCTLWSSRCLVCRRSTRISLFCWLDLHHGGNILGNLDNRVRVSSSPCPQYCQAQ